MYKFWKIYKMIMTPPIMALLLFWVPLSFMFVNTSLILPALIVIMFGITCLENSYNNFVRKNGKI